MKRAIVVAVLLGIFLSMGIGGCSPAEKPGEVEVNQEALPTATLVPPTPTPGTVYGEAPQLAEMVAAGELPPVEERLPKNPVVIQPVERVGAYGGTWRMGLVGYRDSSVIRAYAGYESLLRWDPTWSRILPNLAQSYDVNEDATEFTFHLREGLRWSDGAPFTADDIAFWYEADLLNEELRSSIPSHFKVNDIPLVVAKIDDYTVKFSFAGPNGQFPLVIAGIKSDWIAARPRHYLEQFHIDYNPEGIDALIAEAGVESWVELYSLKVNRYGNPEMPTMNAWVLTNWYGESSTLVSMERNPYYWKIDTDFNQLPYIDRINFTIYSSDEEVRLAAMDGQIDMQHVHLDIAAYYDDYIANMGEGEYDLRTLIDVRSNALSIHFNLVHEGPVLSSVFSNKTFRMALSHAIDRTEVIEQIYGMDLEPRQPAPRRESPYYRDKLENQYTEYNLAYANELLDEAGYDQRDDEGYRLTPEGQRIEFTIAPQEQPHGGYLRTAEMLAEYWHELGIIVDVEELGKTAWLDLIYANQHDVVIAASKGGIYVAMEPYIYMPYDKWNSWFAIPWVYWYQDNSLGEEPPAPVKAQMQLYDQLNACIESACIEGLIDPILTIAEEEFYVMGICLAPDEYMLVQTNFHNVPYVMPRSWTWPTPAPTNPCQYFIDPHD